jgi:hypothetical protein
MIASSFRHVLYLDSDNMPAFPPDDAAEGVLFAPGYERLGAMFWPDYWCAVLSVCRGALVDACTQEDGRTVAGVADYWCAVSRCAPRRVASLRWLRLGAQTSGSKRRERW